MDKVERPGMLTLDDQVEADLGPDNSIYGADSVTYHDCASQAQNTLLSRMDHATRTDQPKKYNA